MDVFTFACLDVILACRANENSQFFNAAWRLEGVTLSIFWLICSKELFGKWNVSVCFKFLHALDAGFGMSPNSVFIARKWWNACKVVGKWVLKHYVISRIVKCNIAFSSRSGPYLMTFYFRWSEWWLSMSQRKLQLHRVFARGNIFYVIVIISYSLRRE